MSNKPTMTRDDRAFFTLLDIRDPLHRRILMEKLPCGIAGVREAFQDGTPC